MVECQIGRIQFTISEPAVDAMLVFTQGNVWHLEPLNSASLFRPKTFRVIDGFFILLLVCHKPSPLECRDTIGHDVFIQLFDQGGSHLGLYLTTVRFFQEYLCTLAAANSRPKKTRRSGFFRKPEVTTYQPVFSFSALPISARLRTVHLQYLYRQR
mgnify:CR=1 FL=1